MGNLRYMVAVVGTILTFTHWFVFTAIGVMLATGMFDDLGEWNCPSRLIGAMMVIAVVTCALVWVGDLMRR